MSLYVGGSIVVKLIRQEAGSARVAEVLAAEDEIILSTLARLEGLIAIDGLSAAGYLSTPRAAQRRALLESFVQNAPIHLKPCRPGIFDIAVAQLASAYCPTLDRLHLAIMEDLGLRRLFTNDDQQASAGRALGFEVLMPR